ncbi:ORF; putative [Atkinsonella hypoxylon virus]|uniref:RNA-directed RNA polymerase n=1 Tax=Atkinsonella hypoxylon virus (isolate 2H) TaxID=647331 RepID=RDRP_AHV2H|nr:Putative RNA dependent RNA polymerase [Atkinsonella hypoxylon virus]Q85055.1 RecName: Full=RNA-directed RNA polymerase [Atkinsonella hypoxylon virus isolate 2H]AAA61829.1 ORF; putative [Atkinsonella hypoxylon virus]prf//2114360A ORF [Atkinsonella hypoxylon virus]
MSTLLIPQDTIAHTFDEAVASESNLRIDEVPENYLERFIHPSEPENFEFYSLRDSDIPSKRIPKNGIQVFENLKYHTNSKDNLYKDQPSSGPSPMRGVANIIREYFPQYLDDLRTWCRPKSSDDSIFNDFNHEQRITQPFTEERERRLLPLIDHFLGIKPYDIVHYCDTRFYPWKLSTRADYFHNHSRDRKAHAAKSHPDFATGPTKKSYFINSHLFFDRSTVHNIKEYGFPFRPTTDSARNETLLDLWFKKVPTELLVRSHISKRDNLKVRPVYNAPMIYIRIECMLFYPLLAQARKRDCCIMYGLETIRGGMNELERISNAFNSFLLIDWSRFDHLAPFTISNFFFKKWLPTKILIDHGYAQISNYHDHVHSFSAQAQSHGIPMISKEYQTPPEATVFAKKVLNLISFLERWYRDMVFVTPDGFAYRRTHAGVPSGILMTQFIDSFVNLTILLDGLIEFGFTDEEIKQLLVFIMGDDNVIFTPWTLLKLIEFFDWFAKYTLDRFGMVINISKSAVTSIRRKIEVLGYTNNYGFPTRSISKLVGQLAYPERHVTDADMCMRAIGFAYASCAQSETFHALCKKVFQYYFAKTSINERLILKGRKAELPGMFFAYPDVSEHIRLDHFPSLSEVRILLSKFQGYLKETPFGTIPTFSTPQTLRDQTQ